MVESSSAKLHPAVDNAASADVLVPLIMDLVAPNSVVDVGCNTGGWLARFKQEGIEDIRGLDGEYVLSEDMLIARDEFLAVDFERDGPIDLGRRFDLALCLECIEHLDAKSGKRLINSLCALSDQIVFSAAIPGQLGVGHKNEQYPDYWKGIFEQHDYTMFDPFRPTIWDDDRVDFWYRQNIFLMSCNPGRLRIRPPKWNGKIYIAKEPLGALCQRTWQPESAESVTELGSH